MKYKNKIKDFTAILIIQLVLTLPFYAANSYALTITNVKVAKVSSNSATIEWNTDNISNGKVRYGKTAALGFTQRHDNFVDNHTVALFNGIDSNANYFFLVESTDLAGNTAIDNNSNSFYTFRTADITPPPQVTGLRLLSAASNSISITWDSVNIADLRNYNIYRNRILIGNSTTNTFNDTNLEPNKDYSYKVSAVDNSSNEGPQSDTLIASTAQVDSTAPVITNIDVLPLTDTTARVTWLTNENSTTIVLYGINKTDKIKTSNDLEINHTIVIDSLARNARIVFIAKSCDASNNCANSSNQSFVAGKDVTLPFINARIPRFVNRRVIDVTGTTEPFSSVTLFLNNMNIPVRSLSGNEVGSSGKFAFSQMQLQQDNVIKIIAVDKSSNKNQKIFETSIDTEDPIVRLNELPSIVSKANLTISGAVNEPVTIKVFLDTSVNESSVPSVIKGLNSTKVSQNSVELRWDESKDKDFSHYVVYREDASPIAITKPANFNLYIDALVDSGKKYTYQVSAVNIFGKEGAKSEPITIATLKGGAILNLKPQEVDILEDFRKPIVSINATSEFNFGITLNKGDGTYKVKIIIEDRAENSVLFDKSVTLDTKKVEIKITSPPTGASIFENVANEIDILGITKPNARVHLFIDRTPFSFFNQSFDVSGLSNELFTLPESKLDAKCRSSVSASFCRTGADFSVDADSNGNFKFERIDLTTLFGGAARFREVTPQDFNTVLLNQEAQESKKATIVVIATDATGQRGVAVHPVRIVTCWSGNQSWDIIPLTQYQSPTFLSTERFAEGSETIYFFFNYTYIGRGQSAKIRDASLSKACGTKEILDPRFNISCQTLPSGGRATQLNPEKTLSYSAIPLSPLPGMDRFLENDWKSFFKAINKEMTFPFKVRIDYEHDVIGDDGQINRVREVQTTCEQVTYVMDNSIIDPRNVLPDWLLFDFVDILQESIKTINQLQEHINKVIDYVAIGCLASIFANAAVKIWRNWMELIDEKVFASGIKLLKFNLGTDDKNDDCKKLVEAVQKAYGGLKLRYFSDRDLEKCFPSSAAAWKAEAKVFQAQRWTCDRIFGHSSPSGWTETATDDELHRKITSAKTCESDFDERGQRIRVENCRDLPGRFIDLNKPREQIAVEQKCFRVSLNPKNPQKEYIYTIFPEEQDPALNSQKIYRLTAFERSNDLGKKYIYAIKFDDSNYMTYQPQTCAQLCGIQEDKNKERVKTVSISRGGGKPETGYTIERGEIKKEKGVTQQKGKTTISACITRNECREWHTRADPQKGGLKIPGLLDKDITLTKYSVESKGYTSDCFFDDNDAPYLTNTENPRNVISLTDPNTREICCCVNGQEAKENPLYYQPLDTDNELAKVPDYQQTNPYVHSSKTKPELEPQPQLKPKSAEGEEGGSEKYSDMEFSYRYSRIGYLGKKYNPNRYISGRDVSACLGQDNLFYLAGGKEKEIVIIDPAKQDTAVLWPCFYLTGINQRLQRIKILMNAMSNCLIQVRTTGRGDTGVCKELFTQHLCDVLWQGVRFFIDGCAPDFLGPGDADGEVKFLEGLKIGLKGIYQGISEAQSEIASEYSNAKLNDLLGVGEESIARKACLFAFGYDWEVNAKNLIDAAYSAPFATLVQAVTRSREFLTVDPITMKPKYEYRASWLINPGCDLERYEIRLACVTRKELDKYPDQISCGSVGAGSIAYTGRLLGTSQSTAVNQCDCLDINEGEQTETFKSESRIKQNSLVDLSDKKIVQSNRRYDHLKFILRPDRKIASGARSNCFPTGYDEGIFYFPIIDKSPKDILDCSVDLSLGLFNCGSGTAFFSRKGIAELVDVTINDRKADEVKTLDAGQPLKVGARVRKTGENKCLKISVSTGEVQPAYEIITENRTHDIPPITIVGSLTTGNRPAISEPTGIRVIQIDLRNIREEGLALEFYDFNEDLSIDLSENSLDLVKVDSQGLAEIKNFVKDGRFIVEKPNFRLQVVSVELERDGQNQFIRDKIQFGDKTKEVARRKGVVVVRPPTQTQGSTTDTSQRKTVIVELLHVKEGSSSGTSLDCNDDDKITTKRYDILVQPTRRDTSTEGPDIGNPIINLKNPRKGEFVQITSKITDRLQVDTAKLVLTPPNGINIDIQPNKKEIDNHIFVINTNELPVAGKYKGQIVATNKKGVPSQKAIPEFEVQCGTFGIGFGSCQASCEGNKRIDTEIKCREAFDDFGLSTGTEFCCRT